MNFDGTGRDFYRGAARPARRLLLLLVVMLAGPVVPAAGAYGAAPEGLAQSIPPQPLSDALWSFARQTGLQLSYVSSITANKMTRGAAAHLAPREALAALLDGTGIRFEFLNARMVRLYVDDAHPPSPPPGAPVDPPPPESHADGGSGTLPPVEVRGSPHLPRPRTPPPSEKERRMLEAAARELESRLEASHRLYGRADLDRYLQRVADRLVASDPEPPPAPVRVRAIKDVSANAFALPDGSVYVTTALLCQLGSEAEVATVLSHEITHFTHSHALTELRKENRAAAVAGTVTFAFELLLAIVAAHNGVTPSANPSLFQLPAEAANIWVLASVSGYSRDLEREADYEGLRRMAAAGYDVNGGIAAFEHLAVAAREENAPHPGHFASHPLLEERITSYRALVDDEYSDSAGPPNLYGRDEYRAQTQGLGLDQVQVLMEAGLMQRAQALVDAVVADGDSARGAYLQGEVARRTVPQTEESEARAIAAYGRAVAMSEAPPAALRQLGILYRRRGDRAAADAAFRAYLERAPQATDAPLVRLYLQALAAPEAASASAGREP